MKNVVMDKFVFACGSGDITTVETLLPSVDPSARNNWAIQVASCYGHIEIVRLLLEDPRVDPSACSNYAIRWASENGYLEVVRLLLTDSRVDPSALENMAIIWAKETGHTEIVDLLTEHQFRLDGPEYTKNIL